MDNIINETRKQEFKQLLLNTGRKGIENVVNWLENNSDFFTAPSSTAYHCNYDGGLLEHSLNVYHNAIDIYNNMQLKRPDKLQNITNDNIAIAALLHDICKTNLYQKITKWRKDNSDNWEQYETYKIVDVLPLGHGEKSVMMLQMLGLDLDVQEMLAIRWHMGSWDGGMQTNEVKYAASTANEKYPLCVIIQCADYMSSMILEDKIEV